ncbi:MAG: hypothetical protein AVDCRST_MAG45-1762, partial [uncultured Solirubrobacterales bacterium]
CSRRFAAPRLGSSPVATWGKGEGSVRSSPPTAAADARTTARPAPPPSRACGTATPARGPGSRERSTRSTGAPWRRCSRRASATMPTNHGAPTARRSCASPPGWPGSASFAATTTTGMPSWPRARPARQRPGRSRSAPLPGS